MIGIAEIAKLHRLGNERGLRATVDHMQRNPDCYRAGANFAVLLISDEDEASVGGDISRIKNSEELNHFFPLTKDDKPESRLTAILKKVGNVNFTFNSIIIKPNDMSCEFSQSQESTAYSGTFYDKLSSLTGGGVGSICDTDYTKSLILFKDKILNTLKVVNLECSPYMNSVHVTVNGQVVSNYKLAETAITFNEPVTEGSTVEVRYGCLIKGSDESL